MENKLFKEYISTLVDQVLNEEVENVQRGEIGSLYLFKEKIMNLVKSNIISSGRDVQTQDQFWNLIKNAVTEAKAYIDTVLEDVVKQEPNPDNNPHYDSLYTSFDTLLKNEVKGKINSNEDLSLKVLSDAASEIKSDLDLTYSMIERTLSAIPHQVFFAAMK